MLTKQRIPFLIVFFFLLSFFFRLWLTVHYAELGSDKCYQLVAAKHINEGKGYSLATQNAENLEETVYRPLSGWPPGYSLLIAALQKLSGDYIAAAWVLDVAAVLVFYTVLWLFLRWYYHNMKKHVAVFMFIFLGFSSAPFYMLFSTDFLSLSFYMLASVLFIRWLEEGQKNYWLPGIFFIAALLPPFLRYGYYPMTLVFPFFLFVMAFLKKKKKYAWQSLVLAAAFLAFIIGYSYFQYVFTGQSTPMSGGRHINEPGRLFFSNLKMFNPFFYNSFFQDGVIVNRITGNKLAFYNALKILFSVSLFLLVLKTGIDEVRKKQNGYFNIFVLLTILANAGYLILVSVRNNADSNTTGTWVWTYVKEFRYYAPSYFFTFLFLLYNSKNVKNLPVRCINFMVFPLMAIGIVYSLITLARGNKTNTYRETHKTFLAYLEELKKHDANNKLVVSGGWARDVDNTAYGSVIQLYNYKVYHDFGREGLVRTTFVDSSVIADNHFDKFWANAKQLKKFDTVFFIGNNSYIKKNLPDSSFHVSASELPGLYLITTKK
jgi:hypothetical protein